MVLLRLELIFCGRSPMSIPSTGRKMPDIPFHGFFVRVGRTQLDFPPQRTPINWGTDACGPTPPVNVVRNPLQEKCVMWVSGSGDALNLYTTEKKSSILIPSRMSPWNGSSSREVCSSGAWEGKTDDYCHMICHTNYDISWCMMHTLMISW